MDNETLERILTLQLKFPGIECVLEDQISEDAKVSLPKAQEYLKMVEEYESLVPQEILKKIGDRIISPRVRSACEYAIELKKD